MTSTKGNGRDNTGIQVKSPNMNRDLFSQFIKSLNDTNKSPR